MIVHQSQFQLMSVLPLPDLADMVLVSAYEASEALTAARSRKALKSKYFQLMTDLEDNGWSVSYSTIEIRSPSHFDPNTVKSLSNFFSLPKKEAKQILTDLLKIAISCSYHILMQDFAIAGL